ncbi:transcriptional repressor [Legionella taurinensis]|uniref:Fur family transcriptional regulator n=1 Tax=Legionella taurinensis TaxID=70611 RepID=A0A3A5LET7_9GAMM|nr:Fur family transcriptional regulator [Legionella taurinensis]MDX1838771.1 Fur family transcriptional regulator [Legionella taurinensis]PUT38635.1 Fur family transcriptional regulator [Legionella taurinensis]PUT39833.1 Fur family transcriptional regulator [Legionella taurinensis]PUT41825.1 Fur family transcriptional regulator [Legionella taurinensis]PUT45320.1 Fur family transcriptional regulator [Legionella taurinensis]
MGYPVAFLEFCATVEHKPTSLRKNVLYILWRSNKPLKAYDIVEQLLQFNANAKPPAVYRVLDYFVALGLVHKIESIQSYSLCQEHEKKHHCELLMVCNQCHTVAEVYDADLHALIKQLGLKQQFALQEDSIEIKGLCEPCQQQQRTHRLKKA